MKKNLRYFMTLLLMMVASVGWGADAWVKTSPADLKTGDVVVIVDQTSSKAMSNDKGTSSAPSAVAVTLNDSKSEIAGTVTSNIQWEVTVTTEDSGNSYKFGVSGTTNCLYSTNTNNGLRVGSGENNTYTIITGGDNNGYYLKSTTLTRFVGCYNSSDWRNYDNINANIKGNNTAFYKKVTVAVAVEAPTFSVAEGTYASALSVELSCVTEGATIYYTTDGTEPTAASTAYTGAISISETTTLKAIAIKGEDDSSVASATYTIVNIVHAGTEADPYTVADARNAIDTNTGIEGVYVTGIVSKVDSYNSEFKSITYWISADGTTSSDQFEVYSGKGKNGADFNNKDDIQFGDVVVIKGDLQKYNSTYEFKANNQLVSLIRTEKDEAGLTYETTEYTINSGESFTAPTLTNPNGLTVSYDSSNKNVATVANDGTVTIEGVGTTIITASFAGNDQYKPGEASYTLTVKSNYTIVDGVFDFTQGEDYGSGLTPSNDNSLYITENHEWTAGNVTLVTSGKYRWWSNDGTLRVFDNTTLTLSVPEGNVITKIVVTGGNDYKTLKVDKGTYTDGTWTGSAQTVVFSRDDKNAQIKTITVTYGNGTEKEDVTMEFSATSATATLGEDFTAPTLTTTPSGLDVTYSSSDENVATVAADGTVTLVAAGTTEITARFAGNNTYNAGEASYTLTVKAQITPITGGCYEKVTSTADITDGEYLIVYEEGSVAFNGGLETLDAVGNTIPVIIDGNKIDATDATNAATFTIDTTNGTLKSASGQYIGVSSNSNGLKQTDDSSTYTHSFSINEDGNAVIAAVFEGSTMTLRYNSASNQARFRYYKPGQQAIQLYKKVSDTPAKVSIKTAASGYTTLVSGEALDIANLPEGLTAYYVAEGGVSTDKDKVTLTQVTAAVPAETPLIFKGAVSTPYEIQIATGETTPLEGNQLAGYSNQSTELTANSAYILSGGEFHPTEDGTFPAGKAYLNVSAVNAKALTISFAETNGINNVNVENNTNEKIFNLAGQQMKSAVKGVYIKNGKKYVK